MYIDNTHLDPKIETDPKTEYEVESKFAEWSANARNVELTDDDYRNPRFSLL